MNALVIAQRELRAQRNLMFGGLAAGLVALALAAIPGASQALAHSSDLPVAAFLATTFACGWVLAAVLGASMLATDLAERRLGFYLNLPLSEGSLLLGKIIGNGMVAAGAACLAALPTLAWGILLHHWGQDPVIRAFPEGFALLLLGVPFLLLLSHAVSTSLRSLCGWTLLDGITLSAFGLGHWAILRNNWLGYGLDKMHWSLMALGLALASLGMSLAAWLQLRHGRSQLRIGHRWLSLALATGAALSLGGNALFTDWYQYPSLSRLARVRVASAPKEGDWIALAGGVPRLGTVDLYDLLNLRTGRVVAAGRNLLKISQDGRRAVGLQFDPNGRNLLDIQTADLTVEHPAFHSLGLTVDCTEGIELSPDGRLLALGSNRTFYLVDLDQKVIRARVPCPKAWYLRFFFPDNQTLRVLAHLDGLPWGDSWQIEEIDLRTGRSRITGQLMSNNALRWDPTSDTLIQTGHLEDGTHYEFREGRTGALKGQLQTAIRQYARLLSDGRFACLDRGDQGQLLLRLVDLQGRPLQQYDLRPWAGLSDPGHGTIWPLAEPDHLLIEITLGIARRKPLAEP